MFNSLRKWCNYTISVVKFDAPTLSGDRELDQTIQVECYPVDGMLLITDKYGKEYVSTTQLYIPSEYAIDENDMILYNGNTYEIRKLTGYYDATLAKESIKVIYL